MKNIILKLASWAAHLLPAPCKKLLYRQPALAGAIRGVLNAAAPEGLHEVSIAAGVLAGWRMELNLHSEKDYWLGTYEPDLQRAAREWIRPGMVVADVGANIGYISLIAARLAGENGHVFAFEALPANITRLEKNAALNSLDGRVTITHAAVTDKVGEAVFLAHESGAMGKAEGSAGRDTHYSNRIRVPALTLDHFFLEQKNPPPQLVKMDIEGGEGLALAGMQQLLAEARPVLLIELHGEQAARQVWEQLQAHGYHLRTMGAGNTAVENVESLDWKAYVIAVPGESEKSQGLR
jgi:FkbM family methyltransferase